MASKARRWITPVTYPAALIWSDHNVSYPENRILLVQSDEELLKTLRWVATQYLDWVNEDNYEGFTELIQNENTPIEVFYYEILEVNTFNDTFFDGSVHLRPLTQVS